jgi:hypothetical protein
MWQAKSDEPVMLLQPVQNAAAVQLMMHSMPCCHAAGVSIDARRCCAAGGTIKAAMLCCVVSLLAMHVAGSWLNLQSQMRCLAATTIHAAGHFSMSTFAIHFILSICLSNESHFLFTSISDWELCLT